MRILAALLVATLVLSACSPAAGSAIGPRAIVEAIIDEQIIPDHRDFAARANSQQSAVNELCATPGADALSEARDRFRDLATSWSRIEWVSFGPARTDNRRETLFFWPDSRGSGRQQIMDLLASDDPNQFKPDAFNAKSVAVKGLPALEYVLFADGAEDLLTPGTQRCAYALAITATISATASELFSDWTGSEGYRSVMLDAGPSNPEYRNHREALQKLLTAAAEQVQIVIDLKLAPLLRESNGDPAPIAPPFSEAETAIPAVTANIVGAANVFTAHAARLLPEEQAYRSDSLEFELSTVESVLAELRSNGAPIVELANTQPTRDQIAYLIQPLTGAHQLMAETFPAALGLTMGFNSLDGD